VSGMGGYSKSTDWDRTLDTPILDNDANIKAPPCLFPQRYGRPAEFASTVVHLITHPMFNGSVVRLDGGLRA
jgi:3-hydroxyacyl-CoA dehydrogenase/3-hydroxy-2-methylbutyryl-CoA dehydrogenase